MSGDLPLLPVYNFMTLITTNLRFWVWLYIYIYIYIYTQKYVILPTLTCAKGEGIRYLLKGKVIPLQARCGPEGG